MKVVAKRIGKSKNESITVDGEIFISSCKVGLWNFLVSTEINHFHYKSNALIGRRQRIESKHRDEHSAKEKILNIDKNIKSLEKDNSCSYELQTEIIIVEREEVN